MSNTREQSDDDAKGHDVAALQAELRQARERLGALETLMESMCNGMSDGIALFDADRRVVHINRAAQEFLGIGPVPPGTKAEDMLLARQAAGESVVVGLFAGIGHDLF